MSWDWPSRKRHDECRAAFGLLHKLPLARHFSRRKIAGNRECHLTRGGPFAAANERGDKTDAFLGIVAVAHRRMENAALAVIDGENHRLMAAGPAFVGLSERRGQDVHVFAGAA